MITLYYSPFVCFLGCATAANSLDAALLPCSRASTAPKGTIDVTFTAVTTSVMMAIVGATPTTAIRLTCTAFPASFLGVTVYLYYYFHLFFC
jgi:hypothetical protein